MVTTPTAKVFKEADSTFMGNTLVYTGKGVKLAGGVAGVIPFGIGSAVETTMGLAGVGISATGDSINNDPMTGHHAAKGATEVGASAALDFLPGGKLANLAGRVATKDWKAPTEVLADNVATGLFGDPKDIVSSNGRPDAPLGTPVSTAPKSPGAKKTSV